MTTTQVANGKQLKKLALSSLHTFTVCCCHCMRTKQHRMQCYFIVLQLHCGMAVQVYVLDALARIARSPEQCGPPARTHASHKVHTHRPHNATICCAFALFRTHASLLFLVFSPFSASASCCASFDESLEFEFFNQLLFQHACALEKRGNLHIYVVLLEAKTLDFFRIVGDFHF